MERQALGLIETVGLVSAIEAADAAVKAAAVRLVKSELTQASLVTIHIEGELGAVQAAVAAGTDACRRVGRLFTHVVIPRPDPNLDVVLDSRGDWGKSDRPNKPKPLSPPPVSKPEAERQIQRQFNVQPISSASTDDYDKMTVAALRRLARRREDVQIGGRDIAMADKETLSRLLREADQRRKG